MFKDFTEYCCCLRYIQTELKWRSFLPLKLQYQLIYILSPVLQLHVLLWYMVYMYQENAVQNQGVLYLVIVSFIVIT